MIETADVISSTYKKRYVLRVCISSFSPSALALAFHSGAGVGAFVVHHIVLRICLCSVTLFNSQITFSKHICHFTPLYNYPPCLVDLLLLRSSSRKKKKCSNILSRTPPIPIHYGVHAAKTSAQAETSLLQQNLMIPVIKRLVSQGRGRTLPPLVSKRQKTVISTSVGPIVCLRLLLLEHASLLVQSKH